MSLPTSSCRASRRASRRATGLRLALGAALVALLATLLTSVAPAAQAAENPRRDFPRMPPKCATLKEKIPPEPTVCHLTKFVEGRPSIVLWGDSHSWMFIPALKAAASGEQINLTAVMMGSCPPMDNQVRPDDKVPACFRSNALAIDYTRQLERSGAPYRLLLSGSWQRYRHALKIKDRSSYVGQMALASRKGTPRLVRTLKAIGADVDVIGQVATVPENAKRCPQGNEPYECRLPRSASLPEAGSTADWLRSTFKPLLNNRAAYDVNPLICTAKVCNGKRGKVYTWFDDLHLSATTSAQMSGYLRPTVDALVQRPTPDPEPEPDPGDNGEECEILGIPIPCMPVG